MKDEIQRRASKTAQVIDVFEKHPAAWLSWTVFADLVGERAYRTRISNARKIVAKHGGQIESRTYHEPPRIITEYRYSLGRDASKPALDRWPSFGPYTDTFQLTPPEAR